MKTQERTIYFPKQDIHVVSLPEKTETLVFILAGQSNMAGRGLVEATDTIPSPRIFTINQQSQLILAKEPLHFYEPTRTGLDCGLSFGKALLKYLPTRYKIILIPTAVGGTKVSQWINDSTHRSVQLLSNFKEKISLAKQYGTLAGILWHQGESDANEQNIPTYKTDLIRLFTLFRNVADSPQLPIIMGELGYFEPNLVNKQKINDQLKELAEQNNQIGLVASKGLKCMADNEHFDAKSIRILGKRYAAAFHQMQQKK
ncbi:MAG: sialate O-acetylesterase [Sphingobacteriia bacterium]